MAKFIINPTSASRREIALAGTALSIGRDPANDLVLPDTMVSRRHAIVELRGNQIFLRDCNSSNGSLVNGDRVAERELKDGDLLAIGATRLLFRDRPPSEPLEGGAKVLPHPSAARLECPACRAEHGVGDQFCRQCGAQLAAQVAPKLLCPSCGSAQPRPAKFCTVCGATLPQGTEGLAVTRPQPALARAAELAPVAAPSGAVRTGPALGVGAGTAPPPGLAVPVVRSGRARPLGSVAEPAARASLRLIAAVLDGGLVTFGQVLLVGPVLFYWWSRTASSAVPFLAILLSLVAVALAVLLGAFYYVYFWGVRGATPGKQALGLVVTDDQGRSPIGVGAAILRLLGYFLAGLPLGIGFVLVPITGRGLQDRMARTRVVQRERD